MTDIFFFLRKFKINKVNYYCTLNIIVLLLLVWCAYIYSQLAKDLIEKLYVGTG